MDDKGLDQWKTTKALLDTADCLDSIEVSLNFVVGLTSWKAMNIRGFIREPVVALIDSGATHDFISLELVQKMDLLVAKTATYGITIGTDHHGYRGICFRQGGVQGVSLHLQEVDIVEDFLPLFEQL